jgi:RNA polymerase sigma-54 factor
MEMRIVQTQKQQMLPRLIQEATLLQMTEAELEERLNEVVSSNPLVEVDAPREAPAARDGRACEGGDPELAPLPVAGRDERGWDDYFPGIANGDVPRGVVETREDWQERSAVAATSLMDDLEQELQVAACDPGELAAGKYILGSLDENGYLAATLEEVAAATETSVAEVERALALIQRFDPAGIAARDRRECLLLQLHRAGEDGSLAAALVREHLEDVSHRRIASLATAAHRPAADIERALSRIHQLDPAPARHLMGSAAEPLYPELSVERENGELIVVVNERTSGTVRLSRDYMRMLSKARERKLPARRYLEGSRREAERWIEMLERRRIMLRMVMQHIVTRQRDFFEHGPTHLRPLTQRELADDLGVNESTVARALKDKYVETAFGVLPIKYFFTTAIPRSGARAGSGDERVSARIVKLRIHELVADEPGDGPLSDEELAAKLRAEGYRLARRTVAKYRTQLGIPSARERRLSHPHHAPDRITGG